VEVNEVILVKRSQQGEGDPGAFQALVEHYSSKAIRTALYITGQKDVAEEAAQEAFIQCYQKIKQLRAPENFEVWFFRILTRLSWELATKEKKTLSLEAISKSNKESLLGNDKTLSFVEASETKQFIKIALRKLSTPLRITIVLRYFNDLSIKEIARVLGCREGTVKSRLHNGLRQLASELELLGWEVPSGDKKKGKNIELTRKEGELSAI